MAALPPTAPKIATSKLCRVKLQIQAASPPRHFQAASPLRNCQSPPRHCQAASLHRHRATARYLYDPPHCEEKLSISSFYRLFNLHGKFSQRFQLWEQVNAGIMSRTYSPAKRFERRPQIRHVEQGRRKRSSRQTSKPSAVTWSLCICLDQTGRRARRDQGMLYSFSSKESERTDCSLRRR